MEPGFESKYHQLEKKHWWFVSRRDIIARLLKRLNIKKDQKILDVGCSGGSLLEFLMSQGFTNIFGIDISDKAIAVCKTRGLNDVLVSQGEATNFNDNQFDVIIASDILEHIKEDRRALQEWQRILKPGGMLIIFVPAFNFLWSQHDEINFHFRRYTRKSLLKKIAELHFTIKKSSYWNFSLFFGVIIPRLFQRLFKKNDKKFNDQLRETPSIINSTVIKLVKIENKLLEFINFPLGTSVFIVCEKLKD
jgi:ubiquinone/menaquinone biosynthesis C-methylase UbiE